eukprot:CAMPEP_0177634322 /NCGR_PEP_ID=MMETSP0447-20121125/3305_1 /TAXON_ID=0 /ORGANISM="Stygamoeba regulata, Strain BSH-02190019" /LENGTH=138 /DNA_ID=CAMNT_0019136033 /DNA_START=87 /DNA_END=503 /DNA_ORIENTATION=-
MVKIIDLVGEDPVLPPHDESEQTGANSSGSQKSGPLLNTLKQGVAGVSGLVLNTAYYTHQGLQACNKVLWYITAAYVVVILPYFHTVVAETQLLSQEKARHIHETQQATAAQTQTPTHVGVSPHAQSSLQLGGLLDSE